jgi:chromosome partitioning protein
LIKTIIPKNTHLTESSFYGKPAILFNAASKGTLAYLELAHELIEKHDAAAQPQTSSTSQIQSA